MSLLSSCLPPVYLPSQSILSVPDSAGPPTLALGFGKAYLESGLCPGPQKTVLQSESK